MVISETSLTPELDISLVWNDNLNHTAMHTTNRGMLAAVASTGMDLFHVGLDPIIDYEIIFDEYITYRFSRPTVREGFSQARGFGNTIGCTAVNRSFEKLAYIGISLKPTGKSIRASDFLQVEGQTVRSRQ